MTEENRLLGLVNQAASRLADVTDLDEVLRDVLGICVEAVGAAGGTVYMHEPSTRRLRFVHVLPEDVADRLERLNIPDNFGVAGEVFRSKKSKISNFPNASVRTRTDIEKRADVTVRSMVTIPLAVTGSAPLGVIQLVNKIEGDFDETDIQVLDIVADICALAVTLARYQERRQQVAALEGMGRAAHDMANKAGVLVTFLPEFERNLDLLEKAINDGNNEEARIYSSLLRGTYEDVFAPYSDRVFRYAKLVNNLAAGKPLEPRKRLGHFAQIVREAAEFMEPPAREARAHVEYDLDAEGPAFEFDDLYVMRIVENLVGNAIKAVSETVPPAWVAEHPDKDDTYGVVTVRYRFDRDQHILSIEDTGPGLPPTVIREILSGSAKSSWQNSAGSGLGTRVIMDLATSHGARVAIENRPGGGAIFSVAFPHVVTPGKAPAETTNTTLN